MPLIILCHKLISYLKVVFYNTTENLNLKNVCAERALKEIIARHICTINIEGTSIVFSPSSNI